MYYLLRSTYAEPNHTVKEEWNCASKEEMLANIVSCLDILHDNGVPYEPTFECVQKNFAQFGVYDKPLIESEFKRLLDGWIAYNEAVNRMAKCEQHELSYPIVVNVDDSTTIEVVECNGQLD